MSYSEFSLLVNKMGQSGLFKIDQYIIMSNEKTDDSLLEKLLEVVKGRETLTTTMERQIYYRVHYTAVPSNPPIWDPLVWDYAPPSSPFRESMSCSETLSDSDDDLFTVMELEDLYEVAKVA